MLAVKTRLVKLCLVLGCLLIADSSSFAGELFGRQTRRIASNQGWIRLRKVYPSTRAEKLLDKLGKKTTPVMSYAKTSPYDNRLFVQEQLMVKYERDYARWESKVASNQYKQSLREEREKTRLQRKLESDRVRAKRQLLKEEARTAKEKARAERGTSGIFGKAFGFGKKSSEKEPSSEIAESKSKKAEAFFGNVEAEQTEEPKKLGFFARLKKAMLGG